MQIRHARSSAGMACSQAREGMARRREETGEKGELKLAVKEVDENVRMAMLHSGVKASSLLILLSFLFSITSRASFSLQQSFIY